MAGAELRSFTYDNEMELMVVLLLLRACIKQLRHFMYLSFPCHCYYNNSTVCVHMCVQCLCASPECFHCNFVASFCNSFASDSKNHKQHEGFFFTFIHSMKFFFFFTFVQTPVGFFCLLDEESKFPQASDQTLIEKLSKNLVKKGLFQRPKGQGLTFVVYHYAGPVSMEHQNNVDAFKTGPLLVL